MERETVRKILLFCRDIDGEINLNAEIIQDYEDSYYSMGSGTQDAIFIKSKNKVSKPTEIVAINVPDNVSGDIRHWKEENERLRRLKAAILQELNKLSLPQKSILYDFYIKGLQWVQISKQIHYSPTQCKKIRNRGLDNLSKLFEKNAFVKKFNYPN